jgi:hypothetical protein
MRCYTSEVTMQPPDERIKHLAVALRNRGVDDEIALDVAWRQRSLASDRARWLLVRIIANLTPEQARDALVEAGYGVEGVVV